MKKIILASKSPRRDEILNLVGLEHEIIVSNADETIPDGISPCEAVKVISSRKATAVTELLLKSGYVAGDFVVVAADTVVDVDGELFGKPADNEDAKRMLKALSGRRHYVHTGVTVSDGEKSVSEYVTTAVYMREIKDHEIEAYSSGKEVLDKAGAYAVQGKAGAFVSALEGDYFNVVGLPLCRTCELLSGFGIELFKSE